MADVVMPFFVGASPGSAYNVRRYEMWKRLQGNRFGRILRHRGSMNTALAFVPGTAHTLEGHPEHVGRLSAIWELLERYNVLADLLHVTPQFTTVRQLNAVHTEEHIDLIRWAAAQGGGMLGPDTYVKPGSFDEARLAAGSACAVADAVMTGNAANGLALIRPPGHHAGTQSAEGFCLFNNVAIVARHLQQAHGIERIAIVDFDVHHGNGTEQIFRRDSSVLFVSTHILEPYFYPGTGRVGDVGDASGYGYTINVPLCSGVGDKGYQSVFDRLILPKLEEFNPQFILVSAGFDAHWGDPLASATLSLTGYAQLCRQLLQVAAELCENRILFILEGGYFLDALAHGILNLTYALQGFDVIIDPLGPSKRPESDISDLLLRLQRRHLLV
ncbi:MAG: histone deacetylase [Anaerolineae bacterium]|nr:histone deacetylase [Anaerolineae bacterium]